MLVNHLACCLQVSEHGLDARPGAQEQVAYRRKRKSLLMRMISSLTGSCVCTVCVSVCVYVHACVGVREIKRPY